MRQRLLAGTSVLALLAWDPVARAGPVFDFMFTGAVQTFSVPETGTYQILAFGAQGGSGNGGKGAEIGGNLSLTANEMLDVYVGGIGANGTGGGGGGGSFVIRPGNTKLVIAGGGGGGAYAYTPGGGLTGPAGGGGKVGPRGTIPNGGTGGFGGGGGVNGAGGGGGGYSGGGGAQLGGGGGGGSLTPV